jgi:hypothetical protein
VGFGGVMNCQTNRILSLALQLLNLDWITSNPKNSLLGELNIRYTELYVNKRKDIQRLWIEIKHALLKPLFVAYTMTFPGIDGHT